MNRPKKITYIKRLGKRTLTIEGSTHTFSGAGQSIYVKAFTDTSGIGNDFIVSEVSDDELLFVGDSLFYSGINANDVIASKKADSNEMGTYLKDQESDFNKYATGSIYATGAITEDEEVVIGNSFISTATATLVFKDVIDTAAAGFDSNVLISSAFTRHEYGLANRINEKLQTVIAQLRGGVVGLMATKEGTDGNDIVLTTDAINVTVSGSGTLEGGTE